MNQRIKAILATLPYREMVELSKELVMEMHMGEPEQFAEALTGLAAKEDTEFAAKEQLMLHQMFTRKKQIVIQPYEKGFKVSVPAQSIDVYCDNVRDGISQVLDNLVALRCMS